MSSKLKRNASLEALCLLLVLHSASAFLFKELKVTANAYTTNVTTSYTIFFDRTITNSYTNTAYATTPLNSSSTVTVTFPIQYSLTNSVSCSYQINTTGSYIASACSQLNNQITISNIFTSATTIASITLLIGNVLNPYPAGKTYNFTGTIGSDVSQPNGVNSLVTITAAASVCSFTFSPSLVYSTQNMIFTLTVTNQFPSSGTIQVQFPLTRLWSAELDSTRLMPISNAMVCGNQSSSVNAAIQCSGSTSFAMVTFSNVVPSALLPGASISFSISNFYSPPTNQPLDAITVTTYTGSSSVDTCNAYVTGLTPKTIPSAQFFITEINNQPIVVNQMYTIKFAITTLDIISLSDYFVITFPTGTSINNFASATLGGTVGFNQASSTYYNQILTLYMQGTGTLQPGQIFITISNFVAPFCTLTTSNFQFQVMSNNYPKMIAYQTIQATTGNLNGTASMGSSTVNALTSYTFSITLSDSITSGGYIKMTFPSILTIVNSTTCAIISGTYMASIPFCYYNPIDNSITLTNLNTSNNNIPAQTFTMSVSGVTNPPSTTTTAGFTVTTFYNSSSSAQVDSGTIPGVTATPGTIDYTKIAVLSSSLVTSDTTVTYYLSFVVQNHIPIGGFIIIYFPITIVFDLAVANSNCQIMVNSSAATTTPCLATLGATYVFNFTNPFPSSAATTSTNITLAILNAGTNPPTTQPISPFSIETYYSDGSSIANVYNASSYNKINTPSNLSSFQISKASNKNGDSTSFTVALTQTATLEAGAVIRVTFPSTLLPSSLTSTCSITYQGISTTVPCGITGNTFKIYSIASSIAGGTSFSITFTNIRNALSASPINGFSATTKTATDLYYYSSGSSLNSISNTIPSQFTSLSYLYTPQQLNSSMSLQLTFQLSQYSLMPGYLQISIDSYFTVTSLSCISFIDFAGNCSSISTNTIKVTGNFNDSVMGLTVTGFSSPNSVPSTTTYSVLNTFDSSGYKIDESSNNISFSIACTLPCMTCSSSNSSSCLSCYSNTQVTASIYYYSPTNYCYTLCPATTYNNNVTLICSPCDSNCYTCSGVYTFCTKCKVNSTYPYLSITNTSQTCVTLCGSGMYADLTLDPATCVSCKSPCATCTAVTTCQSCLSGFYFYNSTCTSSCYPNITIANNATHNCDPCSSICLTCDGAINICTACNTPLVFYNGSCQSSCPSGGSLAPDKGICTPCSSSCLTCSLSITNCTTCNTSSAYPYFVNYTCISTCPAYFYNQNTTGTCVSCTSAPINCANCASSSTCYTCDISYVLHNSKCLNYVPTGYVNISGVAVPCSNNCSTCSVTASQCNTCSNSLNLQGTSCVSNCSSGTIAVSNVCTTCVSPCSTCLGNQFTCTSCLTNMSQPMYLNGQSCQSTCPDSTYANSITFICTNCTNNCMLCSSATVCSSCTNNTYLYNTSCISVCPAGYVGISGICSTCTNNCLTCQGASSYCMSCIANTFYLNSTHACLSTCTTGLFADYVSQTCVGCNSTCQTCANTSFTCTSCSSSLLLYNYQCLTACPSGMYSQGGICNQCPSTCTACSAASNCSGCSGATILYNGQCITSCPATSGYVLNNQCTSCTGQQCYSCTSADVCLSCNSKYLFLNALCLLTCPVGYNSNGTHCNDILNATLTSSISSSNNSFPVPFTIGGVVLIIACLMSRLQFHETYLSGAIYSLIALLEWGALWLFLYLYFIKYMDNPTAEYIGLGAMGFLYIMNFVATVTHSIFLCYEKDFIMWTSQSKFNKCFYWFSNILGFLVNHKFKNILFCKMFTFKIFCAKLDKVEHFRIFNIFSLISLIHSGAAIFAAGIALTYTNSKEQLFHECIDVIVLTGLNAIMAFFNTHKDKAFFEETTPEGYSLHKKNNMMEEHLVGSKFHDLGQDGEVQAGYINSYNHALTSKQALKFDKDSEDSMQEVGEGIYSDSSLAEISEKHYEQISVQALDLIDEKMNMTAKTNVAPKAKPIFEEISIQADELIHEQEQRGINLSELPPQDFDNDTSNFTNYFRKVDCSVQGHLDRGVNYSAQVQVDQLDQSIQNDNRLGDMVDFSVQKFSNIERNDFSIQKDEPRRHEVSIQKNDSLQRVDLSIQYSSKQRDASFQYSNNQQDESVSMSRRSRSFGIQQNQTNSDKSISAYVEMHNQSNQLTVIEQEDEEIQMDPEVAEQGIQPTIEFEDEGVQPDIEYNEIAIQPDIQYEDYAIQPDLEYEQIGIQPDIQYNEIAIQPTLDPSANEMAVQYSLEEPVNYNEFDEELIQSNTASNMVFEHTEEQIEQQQDERQLLEEKVEELEVRNQNIVSYQEELEERIRNKQKELHEIKRKIEFKERMNERKKEEIANKKVVQEEDIELQGIKYVEQRPRPPNPLPQKQQPQAAPQVSFNRGEQGKSSSNSSQVLEEILIKRSPDFTVEQIQLQIQSKQLPKENPVILPKKREPEVQNLSNLSSLSANNQTLEEINIVKDAPIEREPSQKSQHFSKRQKTIEQIMFEDANPLQQRKASQAESKPSQRQKTIEQIRYEQPINKQLNDREVSQVQSHHQKVIKEIRSEDIKQPNKKVAGFIETKPEFTRRKNQQEKKQIQYKQFDNDLLSEEEEDNYNQFIRSNEQPTPKKVEYKRPQEIVNDSRNSSNQPIVSRQSQATNQQREYPQVQKEENNIYYRQSAPEPKRSIEPYEQRKPKYNQETKPQQKIKQSKVSPNIPKKEQRETREFNFVSRAEQQIPSSPLMPRNIQIRDMGNVQLESASQQDNNQISNYNNINIRAEGRRKQEEEEEARSQGNRQSQATKKNYYQPQAKKNVVIDVTEIDQSLKGEEDYLELEEANQSDREPAGLNNVYYHSKPNFREHSRSDLSGTIEQIPKHYENDVNDNEKTLSNNDFSNKRQPRPAPVQIDQQKLTNYFTGNLAHTVNQKGRNHDLPAEAEPEHFRINKLYSNNDINKNKNQESFPRNVHQRQKKNSTLAMAGKAQFTDDKLVQKKNVTKNPLNVNRQWEAQHEDKYISEDDDFTPSNRNNLVRKPVNKNLQNFASHLVLPQETDQQDTSFHGPKKEERAPMSGKLREVRPKPKKQLEEIEVHFESEQLSHDLSINQKNRSPQVPRGFSYGQRANSNLGAESSLYEDESEDVDYRKMMLLGQMQERPNNGDLQDYYQKKRDSKDKRRKSNSKVDRSTEKIYMQKLDKAKRP